jgi:hypothetical protein
MTSGEHSGGAILLSEPEDRPHHHSDQDSPQQWHESHPAPVIVAVHHVSHLAFEAHDERSEDGHTTAEGPQSRGRSALLSQGPALLDQLLHFLDQAIDLFRQLRIGLEFKLLLDKVVVGLGLLER